MKNLKELVLSTEMRLFKHVVFSNLKQFLEAYFIFVVPTENYYFHQISLRPRFGCF